MRPHGRASVDSRNPRAFAICDRCGFLYNHNKLNWQYQWQGAQLQNLRVLVCPTCMDTPQEQLRSIVLPPDPIPVINARPENYTDADAPLSAIYTNVGNLTQGGGVAGAFDANTNKPFQYSANLATSVSSYQNYIGKNWGSSNAQSVTRFTLTAPNDSKFLGGGATGYKLQGGNTGVVWNDIYPGTTAGTIAESIDVTLPSSSPTSEYQYHRVVLNGDGITSVAVAQCEFFVAGSQTEP